MRKLIFVAALMTAAALPTTASADKYFGPVSIHADDYFHAETIFGSVESGKAKCERNRTIKLFYAEFSMGPGIFSQVDETTTNDPGEYVFFPPNLVRKSSEGTFPPGEYFARVTKKHAGNDVCLKDNSRVIQIFENGCFSQAESQAAPSRKGPVIC